MVGTLIGMKLAVLRHSVAGTRATWLTTTGVAVGLALAAGTIWVATRGFSEQQALLDLLALLLAMWMLGWMIAPAWAGQPVLRAEFFRLEPVSTRRLAVGLLASAFVGAGAAITLVAFAALVTFAARIGGGPAIGVAVPAAILQLVLVVLLSRLSAWLFGALARSRVGALVTAVITAAMLVLAQSGWVVFIALDTVLRTGFSPAFSIVVRSLPSGWGLVAIDAAARSAWPLAGAALGGMVVLAALLFAVWSRLLGSDGPARRVVRGSTKERAAHRAWGSGGTSAAYTKELRTWRRDSVRVQNLAVAPAFAILCALLPLIFGSTAFLPFAGALTALMATATCANLYGFDGTALWFTLVMPGTERADVRGRQLAWLTLVAPLSLGLTVAGTALHGDAAIWPWALTATTAALGAGVGLLPLVAVDQLVPGPDPHEIKDSPLDHGDTTGQGFVALFLVLAAALPSVGVVALGQVVGSGALRWAGVAVGVLSGVLYFWLFGRAAGRHLQARGPELLSMMRAGQQGQHREQADGSPSVLGSMSEGRRRLLWSSFLLGCLALFPQGLVPLAIKVSGNISRVWFLALYLPDQWQWPAVAVFVALGVLAFAFAGRVYLHQARAVREANKSGAGRPKRERATAGKS